MNDVNAMLAAKQKPMLPELPRSSARLKKNAGRARNAEPQLLALLDRQFEIRRLRGSSHTAQLNDRVTALPPPTTH
jgi:hypothetical protein